MAYSSIQDLYKVFLKYQLVCTDTRAIKPGSIFFALKGANFNANEFANKALEQGCEFAVIDEEKYKIGDKFLLVNDVLTALQQLASYHRKQLKIPFIAITGSNGKTTTKELIAAVLSSKYKTCFTQGNLNNHIGVPLTLLSINSAHEMAVIEMGANHQKEIEFLCNIAMPDYGMITNIGKAHLEGFGGPEGVIKGKTEMYTHIKKHNGKLFVNADDSLLIEKSLGIDQITYGTKNANVTGTLIETDPFVKFSFSTTPNQKVEVDTQMAGKYNFPNMMAAVAIGNYFKVTDHQIKHAIENYIPSNNRSQIVKRGTNTILLDAYNANPGSMKEAIDNFSMIKSPSKLLLLGDMLELGDQSLYEHQQVVNQLIEKQLFNVILVGPHFAATTDNKGFHRVNDSDQATALIQKNRPQNTTILIKGSRGIKMEKLLEAL